MASSELFSYSQGLLDGGLGTTLEQQFDLDISCSPLWSAKAVLDHPDIIVASHLAFMRAGARIIETATYQCSLAGYEKEGYSTEHAKDAMRKAVALAAEAKISFQREISPMQVDIRLALSLGPFGATLSPAQEFDGYYPPPYGPRGFEADRENINSFGSNDSKEQESIKALAEFHLERLLIFQQHTSSWSTIDCIAFETVPLVREVKAIRQAMFWLQERLPKSEFKPWWISFVLPDGRCPETLYPSGPKLTARDLVFAAYDKTVSIPHTDSVFMPMPTGIGVNCTPLEVIRAVIEEFGEALEDLQIGIGSRPWLVVYPNGGDVYDIVTKTWNQTDSAKKGRWATDLATIIRHASASGPSTSHWRGVIVGGCCRVGPQQISELNKRLHH